MSNYKIVVTVPEDEADNLRQAIGNAGGGSVGNYTHCGFSVKGTGRFLPIDGANPTIGQVGRSEEVAEEVLAYGGIESTCTLQAQKGKSFLSTYYPTTQCGPK